MFDLCKPACKRSSCCWLAQWAGATSCGSALTACLDRHGAHLLLRPSDLDLQHWAAAASCYAAWRFNALACSSKSIARAAHRCGWTCLLLSAG